MTQKNTIIGVIGIAIAIVALITSAFIWTTVDNLEKKVTDLDNRLVDLDNRLAAIENKSWHPVGEYTLNPSKTTESFQIQGEQARITFTYNGVSAGMRMGYNLRVYDSDRNIVAGLGGFELADITNNGKGTFNILEGSGTYTVEIIGGNEFTLTFTVEEFY